MTERTYTVLLYSDDPEVRHHMRLAVGSRPAPDLAVEFVEADNYDDCVRLIETRDPGVLLLDGEAAPSGGLGISRQLDDELDDPPPVCIVIARAADRWLAAYARVDATLMHPLDPIETGQTIARLLHARASGGATLPA